MCWKTPLKVKVTMEIEFDETPDDKGSVDVWVKRTIREALDLDSSDEIDYWIGKELKFKWEVIKN